jgi:hypothetical protein
MHVLADVTDGARVGEMGTECAGIASDVEHGVMVGGRRRFSTPLQPSAPAAANGAYSPAR